ncbi:MAG: DUF485 domain-containing protein [Zoogloeaceae bacterium]|nr:DUF485 domain-containing protein [Zoogloeaceae bacterium]
MRIDDFHAYMAAHPRHAALARERRGQIRRFAGAALLAFSAYLALAIGAADWLARPVWAGFSITWLWLTTFWFALFIIALVVGVGRLLQALDIQFDVLTREVRDALG